MTQMTNKSRRPSRLRTYGQKVKADFREMPVVMSIAMILLLLSLAVFYLQFFTNVMDDLLNPTASLSRSTHVLQLKPAQNGIDGINPCFVISHAQAEAFTGATLHTYTTNNVDYKNDQARSCIYTTNRSDAKGTGAFAGSNTTAFQINTYRERSGASFTAFDQRQQTARLSVEEGYVPINVAAQPELKGATAAFYQLAPSTGHLSGITFTLKGVTVAIWMEPATQQDLLNIAHVAINNFG